MVRSDFLHSFIGHPMMALLHLIGLEQAGNWVHDKLFPVADREPDPDLPPLVFTYTNWRGETSQRQVQPIGLFHGATKWHPDPQWLLRAFDLDKGQERAFAVQDIVFDGNVSLDLARALEKLIYAAQGGNADHDNAYLLRWLADRLVEVHGENSGLDFIRACRERAAMLDKELPIARTALQVAKGRGGKAAGSSEALLALEGIINWCDLALAHRDKFDSHGVQNLTGPAFDIAREVLAEHSAALCSSQETSHG